MKTYEELLKENESLITENFHLKQTLSSKNTNELIEKELAKAIPDAIFLVDRKGNFLKFIPAKDFDSYVPPEVFLGKNIKDILSEELSTKFLHHFEKLFETNETQIIEYELDGKYFEARLVISGNGNVISVVKDITINKKSAIYTQKYNDLIAKAPFGFAYHKIILDEFNKAIDYEFLEINEAFELMTGLKKIDVINHKVTEIIPNIKQDPFNWIEFYGETAINGNEKDFEQYSEPLKRWYKVKVYSTEKYYFSTLFEDITFQKEEEEKAILIEKKYKSLIENAPDIVTVVDSNLNINYISPSIKQIGYKMDTFLKQSPESLIHPDDLTFVLKTLEDIKKNVSNKLTIEYRLKDGNNNWIWVESTFSNMLNDISIQGIVINSKNINDKKIYEEKLIESENKFSNVFKLIPDSILITSIKDGVIIEANNQFFRLSGYSSEELFGKTTLELNLWGKEENRTKIISNLLNNEKVSNSEVDLYSKDGTIYKCSISCEFIELNDEKYILSVIRDDTKRIQIQTKLNNERIRLKTLVETIPDIIWLKDINGVYLSCNGKFESFFGAKEEEIIGKTDFDFVDKELAEFFRENDKKAIYSNKSMTNNEWVTFASDGHKELLQTIKTPMYDYLGNLIGVLGVARDITELFKSQEEIKESEETYSTIVNQAHDAIVILNKDSTFYQFNESAYKNLGYTKEEFKNMNIFQIDLAKEEEIKERINSLELNNGRTFETKHICKNGEIKNVRISTKIITLRSKEYVSAIWTDITDIKKIEEEIKLLNQNLEEKVKERTEQLEQANKDLEAFAYSVSHDLRAPIRHIDGFTKLLKNSLENITLESENYFDKINNASNKMSRMIDDLLKFSRLGRRVLEKTDIDLNLLVKEIIEQYKIDIGNRKIEFIIGELPIIKGDKGLIQIVFENLISNAIKFTSKKDLAIIEINQYKSDKKNFAIYIKDNGVGFDMAYVDKLFGVFQRLHTEQEFSGTGIGLANIKQIIQKHGGSIYAQGEVNKGATFFISI